MEGCTFEGMTSGFFCMPLTTISSDHDIGISPHAVHQIGMPQKQSSVTVKNPPAMRPLIKIF